MVLKIINLFCEEVYPSQSLKVIYTHGTLLHILIIVVIIHNKGDALLSCKNGLEKCIRNNNLIISNGAICVIKNDGASINR